MLDPIRCVSSLPLPGGGEHRARDPWGSWVAGSNPDPEEPERCCLVRSGMVDPTSFTKLRRSV
eukprot:936278-Amphidinium_carterae.1